MKTALVIHGEGNTFNNPTLKAIIDLLGSLGYECHIRYPRGSAPMPAYPNVAALPYGWLVRKLKRWTYDRLSFHWLARLLVSIEDLLLYARFDLILAVDRLGLIEAAILNRRNNTPFVFASFEIMFSSETSRRFKRMERLSASDCCLWIVQDEVRAACLVRENSLDADRKFLLPLASAGPGVLGTARFRDRISIPADSKVAILMGSLADWSMAKEILSSVRDWPPDWVLLVHERYGNTRSALRRLGMDGSGHEQRIYFSSEAPDMVDDLGDLLGGVSAGLALYRPSSVSPYTGKNLENLGFASGKISTFLRYGIPVICNGIGLYAEDIHAYGLGGVVTDASGIAGALQGIPDSASEAAVRYFADHLDFNLRSGELGRLLEQCTKAPSIPMTDIGSHGNA